MDEKVLKRKKDAAIWSSWGSYSETMLSYYSFRSILLSEKKFNLFCINLKAGDGVG